MAAIEYFAVDGMPGQYFACARYGTLSPGACARNYAEAPVQVRAGRLDGCLGCAVGHTHAGDSGSVLVPAPLRYRPACLRCRRSGRDSTSRLLGRMRLVRGHTICISCYNREREVLHGKNAKGSKPQKWSGLFLTHLSYLKNAQATLRAAITVPVFDRVEAALLTLRQQQADCVFFAGPAIVRLG